MAQGNEGVVGLRFFVALGAAERRRRQQRLTAWGEPLGRAMDGLPLGAYYQHETCVRVEEGTAMRRGVLITLTLACAMVLGSLIVSYTGSAQQDATSTTPGPLIYNPYPPGILPDDLVSEIERVRREVNVIFDEALKEWLALPPPTVTGQPPTLQGTGYEAVQILGKLMNFDENMSPFRNRACSSCHMPYAGFSGPIPSVNLTMVAYPGSEEFRAGKRTAQRYTYSPRFPVFDLDQAINPGFPGTFKGGNFWDGRSTGYLLQSPDAEQAQHPPVDTQEHALPDMACIALRLSQAPYRPLFEQVWGAGSLDIAFPFNSEATCATPGGAAALGQNTGGNPTPIKLSPADRVKANRVYDNWGQSISFYESSPEVSPYTSKVDANINGLPGSQYTPDELAAVMLFRGKSNCNSCHIDGQTTLLTPGQTDTGTYATNARPLFTCFGYSNLGLPLNPRDAIFYQTTPDPFGFTANPFGFAFRDLGLGTFLRSGPGSAPNPNSAWTPLAPRMDGRQQVSTVRNVAMTPSCPPGSPSSCVACPTTEAGLLDSNGKPIPYFQKEFFHNGYIKSLKQLVHFYNTRDMFAYNVTSGNCPKGTTEKVDCWPMPEVPNNIDMTVGNLGLTDQEENLLVIAMQLLTDGFTTPYPNINTFTGTCSICDPQTDPNCSPSRQGNETLIPTPPLPPCAPEVCGVAPLPSSPIP